MSAEALLSTSHKIAPVVSITPPPNLLREQEVRRIIAAQLVALLTGGSLPTTKEAQDDAISFIQRMDRFLASGA